MDFYIYIRLKRYERQWLVNKFGVDGSDWKVKFPDRSRENAFLRARMMTPPEGTIPRMREAEDTAIVIPYSVSKPPERYNYVTKEDRKAIEEMVEAMFDSCLKIEVWEDIKMGVKIRNSLLAWMRRNGVGVENYETLLQRINRMIMAYRKKGVEINVNKKIFKKEGEKLDNDNP